MANVYSKVLFESTTVAAGSYLSLAVPVGFVWDVRQIDILTTVGNHYDYLQGFRIDAQSHNVGPIWSLYPGQVVPLKTYHWEGRSILENPSQIRVFTLDDGYQWRICGYQLTLP